MLGICVIVEVKAKHNLKKSLILIALMSVWLALLFQEMGGKYESKYGPEFLNPSVVRPPWRVGFGKRSPPALITACMKMKMEDEGHRRGTFRSSWNQRMLGALSLGYCCFRFLFEPGMGEGTDQWRICIWIFIMIIVR